MKTKKNASTPSKLLNLRNFMKIKKLKKMKKKISKVPSVTYNGFENVLKSSAETFSRTN